MVIDVSTVPELLRPLWCERAPGVIGRIAVVERALRSDPDADFAQGLTDAHKLHGLLGTFGFHEGSKIAGIAEELLEANDPARAGWVAAADQVARLGSALVVVMELAQAQNMSEE